MNPQNATSNRTLMTGRHDIRGIFKPNTNPEERYRIIRHREGRTQNNLAPPRERYSCIGPGKINIEGQQVNTKNDQANLYRENPDATLVVPTQRDDVGYKVTSLDIQHVTPARVIKQTK
jgi:hypothetical protein